jgi:hypothetical protein
MDGKRAEILSAMQSAAEGIRPASLGSASAPPGVAVDIGGINLRQVITSDRGRSSPSEEPARSPGTTPDQRRRDCQLRSVLRLLGIFLAFAAILPLYLVDWLPEEIDHIALWIGFVALLGSMASFAATIVYENS